MNAPTEQMQSEVTRLLAQIGAEYEAAQRGLSGLSSGGATHTFISARMERMGALQGALQNLVGDAAIDLIVERLNTCS